MKRLLIALTASLLLTACNRAEPPPPADIRPVRAEQVGPVRTDSQARYAGEVRARIETALAFRVSGRVASRQVEVGTQVESDQLIATLDPQDYALAASAAQSQLVAARAEAALAQADLRRFSELRAQNFISAAELDRRRTTAEAAQARVRQLQGESGRQDNQQAYTRLAAPHAGVITAVDFEAGQVVAAGQTVARLAQRGGLEARIDVPENAIDLLRQAQTLTIRLWSAPDKTYAGVLRELSPAADPVTRTYSARVRFVAADADVRLGMSATVEAGGKAQSRLAVPQSALFRVNGRPQVWVVDRERGTVAARTVALGALAGERATIESGLAAGEWVVTAGVHKLAPGQAVRLVAPAGR